MRHRPPEFDLDHDEARAEAGLPRLDDSTLERVDARLRAAFRAGEGAVVAPSEVEALLAALDTLRALSNEPRRSEALDGHGGGNSDDDDDDDDPAER
jgi:hypothetical protein